MKEGLILKEEGKIFPYDFFVGHLYGFNNGYAALCKIAIGGTNPTRKGPNPDEMIEVSIMGLVVRPEELKGITAVNMVHEIYDPVHPEDEALLFDRLSKERGEEDMKGVFPMKKYKEEEDRFECLTNREMVKILRDLRDMPDRKPFYKMYCMNLWATGSFLKTEKCLEFKAQQKQYIFREADESQKGTSLVVPEGIRSIGTRYGRKVSISDETEEIILPSSLEYIGKEAFKEYKKLSRVKWNEGLKVIGSSAFDGCTSLAGDIVLPALWAVRGAAFYKCYEIERVEIPSVFAIGARAFENCRSLKYVRLGGNLKVIEAWDFCGCSSLEQINFEEGLKYIGVSAFENCTSLKKLCFPRTLKGIKLVLCQDLAQIKMRKFSL